MRLSFTFYVIPAQAEIQESLRTNLRSPSKHQIAMFTVTRKEILSLSAVLYLNRKIILDALLHSSCLARLASEHF
jgi:hypothetical protein